jgi:DNA-binding transcriptional ArsR family regulator
VRPSLDETFVALGDPARLAVIRLLRKQPRRSSDIAAVLSLSRPTTSRHLGVLRKAGLVEETTSEDDARGREYRLRPQPFARMRSWLDEVEAFWGDQLGSFKAHAESEYAAARRR